MAGGRERLCGGSEVTPSPGWKQNGRINNHTTLIEIRYDTIRYDTIRYNTNRYAFLFFLISISNDVGRIESNRIESDQIRFDCMAWDRMVGSSSFGFPRSEPLGFHFPFAPIGLISIHQFTELHSKRNRALYGCRKPNLFLSLTILPSLVFLTCIIEGMKDEMR
jgi:hypothetical protein